MAHRITDEFGSIAQSTPKWHGITTHGPFDLSELANFMDELATQYWETGEAEPQISIANVMDGYKVIITPK